MSKPPFVYAGGSIIDADEFHIAEVFGPSVDETGAMLAASGELHATLVEVLQWISGWDPNFTLDDEWPATAARARAAIAKAEGRT